MNTVTEITDGVLIRVKTEFREDISQVNELTFFFNYHIEIENHNRFRVQLMHRDWFIFDSLNKPVHVTGEGVIGVQPILELGETYMYTSGCELSSEIGHMNGFYTFKNLDTEQSFRVEIPNFDLIYPGRMN